MQSKVHQPCKSWPYIAWEFDIWNTHHLFANVIAWVIIESYHSLHIAILNDLNPVKGWWQKTVNPNIIKHLHKLDCMKGRKCNIGTPKVHCLHWVHQGLTYFVVTHMLAKATTWKRPVYFWPLFGICIESVTCMKEWSSVT